MKYSLFEFNVEVNDVITPSSCSFMVIEFIKYLIYQKQLIPYPYERLKMYVDKRKKQLDNTEDGDLVRERNTKFALISSKHFKKIDETHTSLEHMFAAIVEELTSISRDRVEEVVLLLGNSFLNPQEVFSVRIPSLNYAHSLKFHSTKRNCRNLFRSIFKSEKFHNIVSNTTYSCPSGLHIMLKMKPQILVNSSSYIPRVGYNLPNKGNHTVINFNTHHASLNSSSDFEIFEDSDVRSQSSTSALLEEQTSEELLITESCTWYQLKHSLRPLTEVQYNGTAITDLWMNPALLDENNV